MIKKFIKKKQNNNSKNKNTTNNTLKTIVSKLSQSKKKTSCNQKELFNPELLLTIDKIKERFGNNVVGFGNNLGNGYFNKLLNSSDTILLQEKAEELLKKYQQIDEQLISFAKAKNTNANIYKKKLLVKEKEEIKQIYISIRRRIKDIN